MVTRIGEPVRTGEQWMSIQARTIAIVGAIAILATVALLVVSEVMVAGGFRDQENQAVREDLQRAQGAIDDNVRTLAASTRDWSVWDETYSFMQGNNPDYYAANLADPAALTTLGVDLAVFVSDRGQIVLASSADSAGAVPDGLGHYVYPGSPLLQHTEALTGTTGLMALARGPALFAAEPILHNDGTGSPAGTLLFVRYVDDAALAALKRTTLTTISLAPLNGATLPADLAAARGTLVTDGATLVSPLSDNEVAGYVRLSDALGAPAYILRTVTNRDIYHRGQSVVGIIPGGGTGGRRSVSCLWCSSSCIVWCWHRWAICAARWAASRRAGIPGRGCRRQATTSSRVWRAPSTARWRLRSYREQSSSGWRSGSRWPSTPLRRSR